MPQDSWVNSLRVPTWVALLAFLAIARTNAVSAGEPVSFGRDLVPALTKAGCNSGACHGSLQGRGNLRLSLLGYDPERDFEQLFKDGRGRRIAAVAPEASLLLRKATGQMAHGGGKRFEIDSPTYRLLYNFIVQGTSPPEPGLKVVRLEVAPAELSLKPGEKATLTAKAHWSDGIVREITGAALHNAVHDYLVDVDGSGGVVATAAGRTSVNVRYCGQVASVQVTIPFAESVPTTEFVPKNSLDELIAAEWKKLGVAPAGLSSDEEFVRRVFLDLIGTLPTPAEVTAFVSDPAPDKRAKQIDALLERPEYVDYWSLKWGDLLRAHRRYLGDKGLVSFRSWIRDCVRNGTPWNEMTRELLTSQGNLASNGPVAYYFIDEKLEDLTETTAQVFLGVRMQCTRCHHHPLEVWGQDDFYGLAAFFTRLQTKDSAALGQKFGGPKSLRVIAQPNPNRTLTMPSEPKLFGQSPPNDPAVTDVRKHLADCMTSPANPYFAKNFVNRCWTAMFGIGLVDPVDDMRATNPASMPTVFDALAKDFVDHGYRPKHVLRTICNSRVYQLASELNPKRDVDGRLCTHRVPRRMPAEVLLDAVNQAAGTQEKFDGLPAGSRAIALPDPTIPSYFLNTFGRPLRNNPCECARGGNPDLSQALHLINSTTLHEKVISETGRLGGLLKANKTDDEIIPELYLATFSRRPTAEEITTVKELIAAAPSRPEGLQDLLWTLLNSSEFVFNH